MRNSYSYTYKKPYPRQNEHFWCTNFEDMLLFLEKIFFIKINKINPKRK